MLRARLPSLLLCAAVLAGCAELPVMEGTISPASRASGAPQLMPLDPILAEQRRTSRAQDAQAPLQARGDRLSQARIADPEAADLAERGRLLLARAERLRARPI